VGWDNRRVGETNPAGDAGVRMLGPGDVRALAARLGARPTKRLGQNFVTDAGTVRRIVRAAGLQDDDIVLEVGPGLGSLTLALLETAGRVIAVEIDPVLAAELPATVADRAPDRAGRLDALHSDALTLSADDLPAPPTALVANLPYNVAVPVVLNLLAALPTLRRGLVMVQAEVAERMTAAPGGRVYGVPSVKTAWYAEARRAGTIGRTVFWPMPNVDSGLVSLTRHDPPATTATRAEVFAAIDAAASALREAGVDPGARGETLDVAAYARIAEHRPGRG
jgi:16S rRNA (adenine1518-N6/adenine1519-N6)-dimethyltransferase